MPGNDRPPDVQRSCRAHPEAKLGLAVLGGVVEVVLISVKPVVACVDPQAWVKAFVIHVDQHGREGQSSPFLFTSAFVWFQAWPKPGLALETFVDVNHGTDLQGQ